MTIQRAARAALARRRSADSLDRESAYGSFLTDRVREHVFERRHARPQVAHLHARRRPRARTARRAPPVARHEHAHHVFVGLRGTRARRRRSASTNGSSSPARLDAQLVDASARLLQRRDRARRPRSRPCPSRRRESQVYSTSGSRCDERIRLTPLLCAEVADQLEHLVAPLRIHAVGRLVEKQQIGIVDQRLRQLDALLHAGRVGLDVAVARLAEARRRTAPRARAASRRRAAGRPARRSRRRTTRRSCRECARRSPACSRRARGSRAATSATSRPSTRIRPRVGHDEARAAT